MDLEAVARQRLAAGASTDTVAGELLASGQGPIAAIKALRNAAGIRLGEAKEVVHRNLSAEDQAAAERLWEIAIAAMEDGDDGATR